MRQVFAEKWLGHDAAADSLKPVSGGLSSPWRTPCGIKPLDGRYSARSKTSWQQVTALLIVSLGIGGTCLWSLPAMLNALYWLCWAAFMSNALLRLAASLVKSARNTPINNAVNENLPAYSVIVALYKEAAIVPQLLKAMQALDYPHDRLEILFALEADDHETLRAFRAQNLPLHAKVIVVPPGFPRTKPRALNHALAHARGDLIVIYDAEDQPQPDQLRAAAHSFAMGKPDLACLQAPLRPTVGSSFIARQFAAEYAVQFDVLLPALQAMRLPFPLGGTSNHFKADVLRAIGGWDAFNVTEDADLGLRLAQLGYQSGLINTPTLETPPAHSQVWLPQRTRWIKGYMQTLLVHTRLNASFRPRVWLGMGLGVGLSVAAAVCYAPFTFLVLVSLLLTGLQCLSAPMQTHAFISAPDLALFTLGTLSGQIAIALAARRAGLRLKWSDILYAPVYWCLQTVAAFFAVYQLAVKPFYWDKTEHAASPDETPIFARQALYEARSYAYGLQYDHYRHSNHTAHQGLG